MNQMRGFLFRARHYDAQWTFTRSRSCKSFSEKATGSSGRLQGLLLELKHEWDELERRH